MYARSHRLYALFAAVHAYAYIYITHQYTRTHIYTYSMSTARQTYILQKTVDTVTADGFDNVLTQTDSLLHHSVAPCGTPRTIYGNNTPSGVLSNLV